MNEKRFHPHNHDPKIKGTTLDFRGRCQFLEHGSTYKDFSGREYFVAEDGSLRRKKDGK